MTRHQGGRRAAPPYKIPGGRGGTHPPSHGGSPPHRLGNPPVLRCLSAPGRRCWRYPPVRPGPEGPAAGVCARAGHGGAQQGLEGTGVTAALQGGAQPDRHQPDRQRDPCGPGLPQVEPDTGQGGQGHEDDGEEEGLAEADRHGATPHVGQQPLEAGQPVVRRRSAGVEGQDGEPAAAPARPRTAIKAESASQA